MGEQLPPLPEPLFGGLLYAGGPGPSRGADQPSLTTPISNEYEIKEGKTVDGCPITD